MVRSSTAPLSRQPKAPVRLPTWDSKHFEVERPDSTTDHRRTEHGPRYIDHGAGRDSRAAYSLVAPCPGRHQAPTSTLFGLEFCSAARWLSALLTTQWIPLLLPNSARTTAPSLEEDALSPLTNLSRHGAESRVPGTWGSPSEEPRKHRPGFAAITPSRLPLPHRGPISITLGELSHGFDLTPLSSPASLSCDLGPSTSIRPQTHAREETSERPVTLAPKS